VTLRQVQASAPARLACSALGYPAAGLRGQAGLPSVLGSGTYAQGTVIQESIFADAGRQSRAGLVVLARDAQALPLCRNEGVGRPRAYAPIAG
jgi:hypothetical protein